MSVQTILDEIKTLSPLEQETIYQSLYGVVKPTTNSFIAYLREVRESRFSNSPHCPYCNSEKIKGHGKYKDRQRYKCNECLRTFNDTSASPMAGTHYPDKWAKNIQCMVEGKTLKEVSEELEIHISTAFYWRHKVLNALNVMAPDELIGVVESDEKYFLESNKGKNQVIKLKSRESRKRGGPSNFRGLSHEQACIVVAMDRSGHIVNKFAGKGRVTSDAINGVIGLLIDKDAILCTDAATNYKAFAKDNKLKHEILNSTKKKYVVKKLYHIQHVNSYHSRIEQAINIKFKGVATKYLDSYLSWLRFLEITRSMDKNMRKKNLLLTMFKTDCASTTNYLRPA